MPPLAPQKSIDFELPNRLPLILYAIIDNSGSMQSGCGGKNAEDDEFSRLDLVKHTLNTIISAMTEDDQLCVIKFSTVAKLVSPLTKLTSANKQVLMEDIEKIHPEGQTNIWDGLRLAIDSICNLPSSASDSRVQIYLLTDGEPTINPPKPLPETLENYLRVKKPKLNFTVNTFGYGYSLDSRLLYDLAKIGMGSFGYIPDSSMVGTVFINSLSNSLVAEIPDLFRVHDLARDACGLMVYALLSALLPSGGNGQQHHQPIQPHPSMSPLMHQLASMITNGQQQPTTIIQNLSIALQELYNICREQGPMDGLSEEYHRDALDFLSGILSDCCITSDPNLGQISKAVEPNYYGQWGRHYLFSVLSAYENLVCINFKDKGMQHFRSNHFIDEQTRIEDIFIQLPPPKPSNVRVSPMYRMNMGNANHASAAAQPSTSSSAAVNMSAGITSTSSIGDSFNSSSRAVPTPALKRGNSMRRYMDVHGGCFTGDSMVYLNTDMTQMSTVDRLTKGTMILSNKGMTKLEAVIRLRYHGPLYRIGGYMTLTAYHPILIGGETYFPCELYEDYCNVKNGASLPPVDSIERIGDYDGYVYDVVLENRGILASPITLSIPLSATTPTSYFGCTGVFYVATWGHDCQLIRFEHDYFGTEKIVQDLISQRATNYLEEGQVVIENPCFIRQPSNGRIIHLICS
jgi:Mg-chelatase subunit ChlD